MVDLENQMSSEKIQSDLLMTVRIANDFQTEAQTNLEVVTSETYEMREKLKQLETENEKLKTKFGGCAIS